MGAGDCAKLTAGSAVLARATAECFKNVRRESAHAAA
jgi:hypothetical protein